MGQHSSASVSALLGLDGFEVVSAQLVGGEWQLVVQATATGQLESDHHADTRSCSPAAPT